MHARNPPPPDRPLWFTLRATLSSPWGLETHKGTGGDTRLVPEKAPGCLSQCAAKIAERRAVFDATATK